MVEADRESGQAGRRGPGRAAEPRGRWMRSARSARTADGPPEWGGGRARKRSSWPTGSGGIGSAQGAKRPSTGRAPSWVGLRSAGAFAY